MTATNVLDVRGLACPLPVLKARKAMRDMAPGTLLEVLATDPLSPSDFDAFCLATGHEMVEKSHADGTYRFLIRASTPARP